MPLACLLGIEQIVVAQLAGGKPVNRFLIAKRVGKGGALPPVNWSKSCWSLIS